MPGLRRAGRGARRAARLDVLAETRPRLMAFSSLAVAVAAALLLGMAVDLTAGPVVPALPAQTALATP